MKRYAITYQFGDGSTVTLPAEEVALARIEQLIGLAKITRDRIAILAEMQEIVAALMMAERQNRGRKQGGFASRKQLHPEMAAVFDQAYQELVAKGFKKIGGLSLLRQARFVLRRNVVAATIHAEEKKKKGPRQKSATDVDKDLQQMGERLTLRDTITEYRARQWLKTKHRS